MKKIVLLFTIVIFLVGCSSTTIVERWNVKKIIKDDLKKLGSDLDKMSGNKYNLEDKVEESI
ncbi:hypothetical protein [Fusobacterium russii]|uniref:hypothetical protein n=1 Tax=Fusobacterium russii TaxID=854 RepID=UPI0003A63205|nr:hypothetical protein [Fusobacterium russii]